MKLKQLTVSIENSPGRLYEVTRALGEAGINLRALTAVDTGGGFGLLRILVSDMPRTRSILMKLQMPARVVEVVAVEIEDYPGRLADLLWHIREAGVNVIYTYAYAGLSEGRAVMIFRFSDNDNAIEVLRKNAFTILDAHAFGMTEAGNGS